MKKLIVFLFSLILCACAKSSDSSAAVSPSTSYSYYQYGDESDKTIFRKVALMSDGSIRYLKKTLLKATNVLEDSGSYLACQKYTISDTQLVKMGLPVYPDGAEPFINLNLETFYFPAYPDGSTIFDGVTFSKTSDKQSVIDSFSLESLPTCN